MLHGLLRHIKRPTVRAANFATRFNRITRYGLDLVLWSRLFAHRRGPIPVELPPALLELKGVEHQPPVLYVSGPPARVGHWDEGFAGVNAALFLNLQTPDILSSIRYAHPAPAFQGIYLWDSAFIAQVWKPWDLGVARDVNRAVIELRDGERLQHVVADFAQSSFTQPPVLAWSIALLHDWHREADGAEEYLDACYKPLVSYNDWLYKNRCLRDGLFFWEHPYESGVENAPRFSNTDESVLADTTQMAAPDLSAYVALQNEALAEMAEALGRRDEAEAFEAKAAVLRQKMNEVLWHEGDGLYYDRHVGTGEFVRSKTIASLLPLWAGVPGQEQAERLREHALDPNAFNTPIPLPSVARDDPDFEKDMWRGPVWINTAYGVILGLERYGFHEAAAELAYRLCDGVYRTYANCRRIYEFYDPERFDTRELNRKLGNRFKLLTLGNKPRPEFVGWSGLVNTLVIEHLIGFQRDEGHRLIQPRFPEEAVGLSFSLRLPSEALSLDVEVLEGMHTRGAFRSNSGVRYFEADCGERISLDALIATEQAQEGIVRVRS